MGEIFSELVSGGALWQLLGLVALVDSELFLQSCLRWSLMSSSSVYSDGSSPGFSNRPT